jgi:hypothetical protein
MTTITDWPELRRLCFAPGSFWYTSYSPDDTMAKTFPPVQPGGSLILAWQVKDKKVLIVGGGEVSIFPKASLFTTQLS